MNDELIKNILKVYLQNIDIEGKSELEAYLEASLDEFLFEILFSIYEENKNALAAINCEYDATNDYIFKGTNGEYPLDTFLINRLLKNVAIIKFQEQYLFPESHYDADLREILLDAGRLKKLNKCQRRKVVYHEFLHALKTDFINEQFFLSKEYFELKEKIKELYPDLVNDFEFKVDEQEGIYDVKRHIGLIYSKKNSKAIYNNKNVDDVDEMLNESDSIILSKDTTAATFKMKDSNRMLLVYNPESSNVTITNYGFLLRTMLNKKILFIGQYLEPSYLINYFNILYNDIFRYNFKTNDTAWNIYCNIISKIKNEQTEKLYIDLLNTIYDCVKYKNELLESNGYDSKLNQDIRELRMRGLVEQNESGFFTVSNIVKYNETINKDKTSGRKK